MTGGALHTKFDSGSQTFIPTSKSQLKVNQKTLDKGSKDSLVADQGVFDS